MLGSGPFRIQKTPGLDFGDVSSLTAARLDSPLALTRTAVAGSGPMAGSEINRAQFGPPYPPTGHKRATNNEINGRGYRRVKLTDDDGSVLFGPSRQSVGVTCNDRS